MANERMEAAQRRWLRMYQGQAEWLAEDGMVSLGLAAAVAAEVARMATVELHSEVTARDGAGAARAAYLDGEYRRVIDQIRPVAEVAAAGGSLMLKPYVEGRRILVDFVRPGSFEPLSYDGSGMITGCRFFEQAVQEGVTYTRVEEHHLRPEGVYVSNRAYREDGPAAAPRFFRRREEKASPWGRPVPLGEVDRWRDLAGEATIEGVRAPLYAHLRMPFANTVDPQSPLGVSVFARVEGLIREADRQFSRLLWEMQSGERALYVDLRAFAAEDAEPGPLPLRRFYRTMDMGYDTQRLFDAWSPPYREASHLAALNEILQRVEDGCGLSRGTLSQAPESASRGARTATELKIMRQRTYAMVRDTQKAIEVALRDLVGAMDVWASVAGLCPAGAWEVGLTFDDSVVMDRGEAFAERVKLVEMGVMGVEEMREWYGVAPLRGRMGDSVPPTEPPWVTGPGA